MLLLQGGVKGDGKKKTARFLPSGQGLEGRGRDAARRGGRTLKRKLHSSSHLGSLDSEGLLSVAFYQRGQSRGGEGEGVSASVARRRG